MPSWSRRGCSPTRRRRSSFGADPQLDPALADGPSSAEAADGTKIENVKLSWLDGKGQNAVGDELTVNANSNDKIDIRARIDIKLKGPKKYAPGMVRIKVPMNFLKDRNGLHVGEMVMSVPEAPGGDATFSYVKMDESYVIINNVEIPGSSAMYFEFSCKGITPKDLKSGTKAAMRAAAELRAETGELLTAASKEATVTVNTSGRVSYPSNTVDRLSEKWQSFLPSELEPENPKDYVYCDFYSSASISSGQPFDLEVTHDASGTGRGARMLGMRDQYGKVYKNEDPTSSKMTVQLVKGDYPYGNYGAFVHAYVAFPKSSIETNGRHLFKDHVTYTMKTVDDQVVTSTDDKPVMGSPDAEKVFAPLEFVIPHGHFHFSKRGSIPLSENGKMVSWGLPNTTALNELQRGREAEVSWYMRSESFNAPYTWLDENGDKKMEAAELEKTSVAVETKDSGLTIPAADLGTSSSPGMTTSSRRSSSTSPRRSITSGTHPMARAISRPRRASPGAPSRRTPSATSRLSRTASFPRSRSEARSPARMERFSLQGSLGLIPLRRLSNCIRVPSWRARPFCSPRALRSTALSSTLPSPR